MSKTIPQYISAIEDLADDQIISPLGLAANLRLLMNKSKLTESELSRRTGVPQPMINRILNGQNTNPKIETLMPISEYFMITLSQLIGEAPLKQVRQNPVHKGLSKVPLISWQDILTVYDIPNEKRPKQLKKQTVMTDMPISDYAYAVKVIDESMEPKFQKETILIIDPDCTPQHRSYVIIHLLKTKKTFFRQILIEENNKYYFKPLNPVFTAEKTNFSEKEVKILGTLIQSRTDYMD